MNPNEIRLDFGISDTLERLRACGLSNRCIDIFRNDKSNASNDQLARRFRKKILARRQFGKTGPKIVKFKRGWSIGSLPRRKSRSYLLKYLEPLVDAEDYTDFLTRLALGGTEFDISAEPIVKLDAVDVEDITLNAYLQIYLEEDGRAVKTAERLLAKLSRGDGLLAKSGGNLIAEPQDRFLVELVPFVQYDLLYLDLMLFALSPADTRRETRTAVSQAVAQTYGQIALAAVPTEIMYHAVHGSAVVEDVLPRLEKTSELTRLQNQDTLGVLEPTLGPEVITILSDLWSRINKIRTSQAQVILNSARKLGARRSLITGSRLPSTATISPSNSSPLIIQPSVMINNSSSNNEIYWIDTSVWPFLQAALLLTSQAGVRVYLTAACNRWGGRHPPHMTHRSGIEVDIDWSFELIGADVVPNLPKGEKVLDPAGPFHDPKKGRFDLKFQDSSKPRTHHGTDALASWIVYQAFVLTGFTRLLYSDAEGLSAALGENLAMQFPHLNIPTTWPLNEFLPVTRPSTDLEALVEPSVHFNHLHAEWQSHQAPKGAGPTKLSPADIDTLVEAARRRDKDSEFHAAFFTKADGTLDTEALSAWNVHSTVDTPSLLPVWHIAKTELDVPVSPDPLGTRYDTVEETLLNAAVMLNQLSAVDRVEYATTLFRDTQGRFGFVEPGKGEARDSDIPNLSSNRFLPFTTWVEDLDGVVANLHSHVSSSVSPSNEDFEFVFDEREKNEGAPSFGLNFVVIDTGNLIWYDSDPVERGWGEERLLTSDVDKALADIRSGVEGVVLLNGVRAMSEQVTKQIQARK